MERWLEAVPLQGDSVPLGDLSSAAYTGQRRSPLVPKHGGISPSLQNQRPLPTLRGQRAAGAAEHSRVVPGEAVTHSLAEGIVPTHERVNWVPFESLTPIPRPRALEGA